MTSTSHPTIRSQTRAAMLTGLALLGLAVGPLGTDEARAASILVNTADDEDNSDGDCSLREAVIAANTNSIRDDCNVGNAGMDTITILVNGTITLASEITVTEALSIVGLGTTATVLDGGLQTRHFLVDMPANDQPFSIMNLTLQHGRDDEIPGSPVHGGGSLAILGVGDITLDGVRFDDNRALLDNVTTSGGGAVLHYQRFPGSTAIVVRDSVFFDNVAGSRGGAIVLQGTIGAEFGPLSIERSRFQLNAAGGEGGAITASGLQQFSIVDSVFESNLASSGICCAEGGAAELSPLSGALGIIERSSFIANEAADNGGALYVDRGVTIIRNSTFHENRGGTMLGQAMELVTGATAAVFFSTFHDNGSGRSDDAAVNVCATCSLSLDHSIVWARWSPATDCRTTGGSITSQGWNIDSSGTCTGFPSDLPSTDPQLLPLADYGDNASGIIIPTLLPHPDGPVVEGGYSVCPGPFGGTTLEDQRGVVRPAPGLMRGGAVCDIGAVEYFDGTEPAIFDLDVATTAGGTVRSQPAGVECPADCSMSAAEGFVIALTAQADPGFEFVEWSGACSGSDRRDCDVAMNGPRNVTATFQPEGEPLSITLNGNGVGSVFSSPAGIACPGDCEERFPFGTIVTLTPSPASGSEFLNWAGDCTGSSCQITLDAPRQAIAVFGDGDLLFLDGFE